MYNVVAFVQLFTGQKKGLCTLLFTSQPRLRNLPKNIPACYKNALPKYKPFRKLSNNNGNRTAVGEQILFLKHRHIKPNVLKQVFQPSGLRLRVTYNKNCIAITEFLDFQRKRIDTGTFFPSEAKSAK